MGIVKSYSIEGANLVIREHLHWTFEADRQDSVRIWRILKFDKASITPEQLEKLIHYQENADFEVEERMGKKQLCISTYLDQGEYRIICDDILSETRPYNLAELTDIILNYKSHSSKSSNLITRYTNFIAHLKSYLENEKVKREGILEQDNGIRSESVIKANAKLSLVNQILNIIEEFNLKQ